MIKAFTEGFLQLKDPRLFKLLVRAAGLALVLYTALFLVLAWLLRCTQISEISWIEDLADWGAGLAAGIVATILFSGLVTAVCGVLLNEVAASVEALHYPNAGPARRISVAESLVAGARLAAWSLGINLLFLPLYFIFLFVPPINLVIFAMINGRIIGKD